MSEIVRRRCPDCGKDVPVRRNGALREHYVYRPQAELRPLETLGRVELCVGSGRSA